MFSKRKQLLALAAVGLFAYNYLQPFGDNEEGGESEYVPATFAAASGSQNPNVGATTTILTTTSVPMRGGLVIVPGAFLDGVDFASLDLSNLDLSDASLAGANLRGANLSGANLSGADLRFADLTGATLYGGNLREVNLSRANLNGANLESADLSSADLWETDFSRANLRNVQFNYSQMTGTKFREANVTGASFIDALMVGVDLTKAIGFESRPDSGTLNTSPPNPAYLPKKNRKSNRIHVYDPDVEGCEEGDNWGEECFRKFK